MKLGPIQIIIVIDYTDIGRVVHDEERVVNDDRTITKRANVLMPVLPHQALILPWTRASAPAWTVPCSRYPPLLLFQASLYAILTCTREKSVWQYNFCFYRRI